MKLILYFKGAVCHLPIFSIWYGYKCQTLINKTQPLSTTTPQLYKPHTLADPSFMRHGFTPSEIGDFIH